MAYKCFKIHHLVVVYLFHVIASCFCFVFLYCNRLPIPRPGEVLGLVGTNGIGKSTALKILAGKQKPNLGKYDVCIKDYGN
jgi:ABC-type siderophore export system fused ATPase/permease subunit